MAGKGPPKTPTLVLQQRGSHLAKRRLNEPKPTAGAPNPPTWLKGEALREWKRLVGELDAIGLLTAVDRAAFAMLCQAWGDYVAARADVERMGATFTTPKGYVAKNPMVTVRTDAFERWRKLAREFGLTPAARASLATPKVDEDENRGRSQFGQMGIHVGT